MILIFVRRREQQTLFCFCEGRRRREKKVASYGGTLSIAIEQLYCSSRAVLSFAENQLLPMFQSGLNNNCIWYVKENPHKIVFVSKI